MRLKIIAFVAIALLLSGCGNQILSPTELWPYVRESYGSTVVEDSCTLLNDGNELVWEASYHYVNFPDIKFTVKCGEDGVISDDGGPKLYEGIFNKTLRENLKQNLAFYAAYVDIVDYFSDPVLPQEVYVKTDKVNCNINLFLNGNELAMFKESTVSDILTQSVHEFANSTGLLYVWLGDGDDVRWAIEAATISPENVYETWLQGTGEEPVVCYAFNDGVLDATPVKGSLSLDDYRLP